MNLAKQKKSFFIAIIIESIICLSWLFIIPSDPKNAFFLGFSKIRWIQGGFIVLTTPAIIFLLNRNSIFQKINYFSQKYLSKKVELLIGQFNFLLFLLILFTPSYFFSPYTAEYIRIKPMLIWGLGLGTIYYFFLLLRKNKINLVILKNLYSKMSLFYWFILFFLIISGIWIFLENQSNTLKTGDLVFSPPAPITTFQIFSLIFIFIFIIGRNNERINKFFNSVWAPTIIFIVTFLVWYLTPLPCTNDVIGPYPPNYICYPQSTDDVYSIASHYGRLGNGIYNQWFTDKPLYIFFLMILQWITSSKISDYITAQLFIFALIPVIAFIFLRKLFNWKYGLFFSFLLILHELNQLSGYQYFGGVNSKLEATEIFTALLLIVFCVTTFYWYLNPTYKLLSVLAGGLLGFASLSRLNPTFIFPIIILSFFFIKKINLKKSILATALFTFGFIAVFSPWYVFSVDQKGQNYLLKKVEDVLDTRYDLFNKLNYSQQSKIAVIKTKIKIDPLLINEIDQEESSRISKISYHFANNLFQSFFILPTRFTFDSLANLSKTPVWKDLEGIPIWDVSLSFQNIFLLLINIFIVFIGIRKSFHKYQIAGLVPLFIQFGYLTGNCLALTSGNRYILPVIWITFLYYSIGICIIFKIILGLFSANLTHDETFIIQKKISKSGNSHYYIVLMLVFGLISFGLSKLYLLPDRIPVTKETSLETQQELFNNVIQNDDLNKILNINEAKIYQGISFQPKYYRNYFFPDSPRSFELITLSNNEVIVSYIRNGPDDYFSDESTVIIIGCPIKEENRWGAKFVIVDALAIIQEDHEETVLISSKLYLGCQDNQK